VNSERKYHKETGARFTALILGKVTLITNDANGSVNKKKFSKEKNFVSEINVYYDKENDNSYTKRTSIVSLGKS